MTPRADKLEFIIAAALSDTDECIPWPWARTQHGYGQVHFNGTTWRAHALVTAIKHGHRPSPAHQAGHVAHSICGCRSCINPKHLAGWQTTREQTKQKRADGTWGRTFSDEELEAIREDPRSIEKLAKEYGVSPSTIRRIRNRQYAQLSRRRPSFFPQIKHRGGLTKAKAGIRGRD